MHNLIPRLNSLLDITQRNVTFSAYLTISSKAMEKGAVHSTVGISLGEDAAEAGILTSQTRKLSSP
jgi:hypothetical protein